MTGRYLILLPDRNTIDKITRKEKRDWSNAFLTEAQAFAKMVGTVRMTQIDVSRPMARRRRESLDAVALARHKLGGPLSGLAIFCHGWCDGIQIGWTRRTCGEVARVLADSCLRDLRVALYCCSTGSTDTGAPGGDGGFADTLRDHLCRAGLVDCQVDAHDTPGHTTRNPRVRRFRGQGSPTGGQGGQWIVEPGRAPLWGKWVKALQSSDLRLRYPVLTVGDIHTELV